MSATIFDYVPGQSEALTDEPLDVTPQLNIVYNFKIDDFKHVFSNIVLEQGGSPIPESAYDLFIDTDYTNNESGETGDTLYGAFRITNATYANIATTISGDNFGAYATNEAFLNLFNEKSTVVVGILNSVQGITATGAIVNLSGTGFSSGIYTIPKGGEYELNARFDGSSNGSMVATFYIRKNSSTSLARRTKTLGVENEGASLKTTVTLLAGDTVELFVNVTANTYTLGSGVDRTALEIKLV